DDGRGGTDLQPYTIVVHPQPGNHPPKIISTPIDHLYAPLSDFQPGSQTDQFFTIPGVRGQPVTVTFKLTDRNPDYQQNEAGYYRILDGAGHVLKPATPTQFDFGTSTSPVAAGYTKVDSRLYNAAYGYGWVVNGGQFFVNSQDRGGSAGTDLTRDFNETV